MPDDETRMACPFCGSTIVTPRVDKDGSRATRRRNPDDDYRCDARGCGRTFDDPDYVQAPQKDVRGGVAGVLSEMTVEEFDEAVSKHG